MPQIIVERQNLWSQNLYILIVFVDKKLHFRDVIYSKKNSIRQKANFVRKLLGKGDGEENW